MMTSEVISVVSAMAIVFIFWRQGANTASSQVIATYREQVKQLTEQVATLTSKVGELTGALKEKDDRIKTLEAIATNRNPEMEIFMKTMNDAVEQGKVTSQAAQEYMQRTSDDLHMIKNILTVQNIDHQLKEKRQKLKV